MSSKLVKKEFVVTIMTLSPFLIKSSPLGTISLLSRIIPATSRFSFVFNFFKGISKKLIFSFAINSIASTFLSTIL